MIVVRPLVRVLALSAVVAGVACSGDPKPTGPAKPPSPTALIGQYRCLRFLGYYAGSSGTGYYQGSCNAYVNVTNPSRALEIERQDFVINDRFEISRPDFETGTFVYDSAAARAVVNYSSGRASEVFEVWIDGPNLLRQTFAPWDYTGDGLVDSLRLTFQKQ
jgi:hypothetical protein